MKLYNSVVLSALKVEARNVVNTEEIDKYIASLLERCQTDKVKKWLKKTFRKYLINNADAKKVTSIDPTYPDYINDALLSGQEVFKVISLDSIVIRPIIDYLNTLDTINFGYDQAKQKSDEWHRQLPEKTVEVTVDDDSEIVKKYENGYTWRKLKTKDDYVREGDLMGHCVGRYNPGDHLIYSLRSVKNEPHTTIDLSISAPYVIEQVKGQANTIPFKYKPYVIDFMKNHIGLNNFELEDPDNDLAYLGILITDKFLFNPQEQFLGEHIERIPKNLKSKLFFAELFTNKKGFLISLEDARKTDIVVEKANRSYNFIAIALISKGFVFVPKPISSEVLVGTIKPLFNEPIMGSNTEYNDKVEEILIDYNPNYLLHSNQIQHLSSVKIDKKLIRFPKKLYFRQIVITDEDRPSLVKAKKAEKNRLPIKLPKNAVDFEQMVRLGYYIYLENGKFYLINNEDFINKVTNNRQSIGQIDKEVREKFQDDFALLHRLFLNKGVFCDDEGQIIPLEMLGTSPIKFKGEFTIRDNFKKVPTKFWSNIPPGMSVYFRTNEPIELPELSCHNSIHFSGNSTIKIKTLKAKKITVDFPDFFSCDYLVADNAYINVEKLELKKIRTKKLILSADGPDIVVGDVGDVFADRLYFEGGRWELDSWSFKNDPVLKLTDSDVTILFADLHKQPTLSLENSFLNGHYDEYKAINSLSDSFYTFENLYKPKRTKNLLFLRKSVLGFGSYQPSYISMRFETKKVVDVKDAVFNSTKRKWELCIVKNKQTVCKWFYLTAKELRKAVLEFDGHFTKIKERMGRNQNIVFKETEMANSPFGLKVGQMFIKKKGMV